MRERITTGETPFRKAYLRSIVDAIEVDDKVIRIHGSKTSLEQAIIAGEQIGKGVRSFVRKWRSQGDSNPCFRRERATSWTARRWEPALARLKAVLYIGGSRAAQESRGRRALRFIIG